MQRLHSILSGFSSSKNTPQSTWTIPLQHLHLWVGFSCRRLCSQKSRAPQRHEGLSSFDCGVLSIEMLVKCVVNGEALIDTLMIFLRKHFFNFKLRTDLLQIYFHFWTHKIIKNRFSTHPYFAQRVQKTHITFRKKLSICKKKISANFWH